MTDLYDDMPAIISQANIYSKLNDIMKTKTYKYANKLAMIYASMKGSL